MNRSAPWWLTWLLTAGVFAFLVGERVLESHETARAVVLAAAGLVVLGCVGWRLASWRSAPADARRVEGILLLAYAGCALALAIHVASTQHGIDWLGIDFVDDTTNTSKQRYVRALQVLWAILLTISIVPALTAQVSVGAYRHTQGLTQGLEALRVQETASGGLSVALACTALFLVCYIAAENDKTVDMSYFKTSAPGTTSSAIVASMDQPLEVNLFFPNKSDVKEEALRYFRALGRAAGDRVQIHEYDRLADPKVAETNEVTGDGTIVLRKGDRVERMTIGDSMDVSRVALRKLDADVQTLLMLMLRTRRAAYITKGHGEINDSISEAVRTSRELRGTTEIIRILSGANYDQKDLGIKDGLGREVPGDAAIVLILGPQVPFLPEELDALDRYLARGGKLLIGLDPDSKFELGPLEKRLGLKLIKNELVDDQNHLRQHDVPADRRLIITDRFSQYPAAPTLWQASGSAVVFAGAGSLELADTAAAHVSFLVRSLSSTFADVNGNYEFEQGKEERKEHYVVASVESKLPPLPVDTTMKPVPLAPPAPRVDTAGMRAFVVADAEAFTDPVLNSLGLNAVMINDGVKWLGHEEGLAGTTESEQDVPIQHTQSEDVIWFYSTILGAPMLMLALGLVAVFRRQKRPAVAA